MLAAEPTFSIREAATCPRCGLNQYTTIAGDKVASSTCRRCGHPIGIVFYAFQPTREENGLTDRASIQNSIGAFLRRLRMRRHISQQVLSKRLAVHRTVLSRVKCGHVLNLAILLRAAVALDLDIDQIFVRVRDCRSRQP
jgi:ribosome-binding protein aMBF1 (putative translation factor)